MTYFTRKRFKKKCIQGNVNIPYGTVLEYKNNLLYYNNKPVCVISSQDGLDYFVGNQDNQGKVRASLIDWILDHTKQNVSRYNDIWNMIWNTKEYQILRRQDYPDRWIWYVEFNTAPIELLEKLKNDIQRIEQGECN